jgi:predicted secreted protein
VEEIAGKGLIAKINGEEVLVGTVALLQERGVAFKRVRGAYTNLYVTKNGEWVGVIEVGDKLRDGVKDVLAEMKKRGVKRLAMLTGDNEERSYKMANKLGVTEVYAELLPNQKWKQVEELDSDVNTEYDEGACCFSSDGKTMYFTRCTHDPEYPRYAQIYTSERSDASWGAPKLLEIAKDTLSSFAHPTISPDGSWLYFVSDMPGGIGGLDIWRIQITQQGLGGVDNPGEPINTPGDEMFPSFRPNGDLYFSSNGHVGMGGLDLFKAEMDSTGNWSVENLKYPMNSMADDFGITFDGLHNRGFFCTNRGDGRGWDHIMSFSCPEVLITVKGGLYGKAG